MSRTFCSVALVALLATLPATGQAAIITFDNFTGLNVGASPTASYSEAGFTVTSLGSNSLSNVWAAELTAGNPARSMDWDFSNTGPVQTTLAVTRNGGLDKFVFNSIDFQAYNLGGASIRFLVEGSDFETSGIDFSLSGQLADFGFGSTNWTTVSGDGNTLINTLFITVFYVPSSTIPEGIGLLLDNINVSTDPTSVPTPATLALVGLGLAGLGWSRRKNA